MLSNRTVEFLNSICKKSNEIYSQGGLIYLYRFGYHKAHSFIENTQLVSAKENGFLRKLDDSDVKKLERLFDVASNENAGAFVSKLIGYLYEDLPNMYCFINYDESCTSIDLSIDFVKDNNFHSLEFFWSLD